MREPCAVYMGEEGGGWEQGDGSSEQFDCKGQRPVAANGCRQRFWLSWEDLCSLLGGCHGVCGRSWTVWREVTLHLLCSGHPAASPHEQPP